MIDLLCIGNLTIDEAVRPDGKRNESLGGDAIFAALAARHAGASISWLAPVGHDFPEAMRARLTACGLETSAQPQRPLPTVRNVVTYDRGGGRSWHLLHGQEHFEAMSARPTDVAADMLAARGVLVLGMGLTSQLDLLAWLRGRTEATVYLDVEEDGIVGREDEVLAALPACDVFLPSEIEACRLTDLDDPTAAAVRLAEAGPSVVVVKLAERGAVVVAGGPPKHVPVSPLDAVDPTGAGDAFCGGFAAAHLRGESPVDAVAIGAAEAAIAISAFGVDALLAVAGGCPA